MAPFSISECAGRSSPQRWWVTFHQKMHNTTAIQPEDPCKSLPLGSPHGFRGVTHKNGKASLISANRQNCSNKRSAPHWLWWTLCRYMHLLATCHSHPLGKEDINHNCYYLQESISIHMPDKGNTVMPRAKITITAMSICCCFITAESPSYWIL